MWKNLYFKIGILFGLFILALLIVLPRIPITERNDYINIDTHIGGYYLNFFNNRLVFDLRDFKRGLDLKGGVRILLKVDMSKVPEHERADALEAVRSIVERRVNYLGVAEPYIAPIRIGDEYRIQVEIPGIENVTEAVELIGQTTQLKFKVLKEGYEWDETKFTEYYIDPEVWEDSGVTGADLRGVEVTFSGDSLAARVTPEIRLQFTNEGRKKFEELAKANINKPVGLFLDDDAVPLSMPIVSPSLAEGLDNDPVISGSFDTQTANALSINIRAGSLPAPVEILQQETIEASLGRDSIERSFKAGIVGLVAILVFMVVVYGKLGLIADLALIFYVILTLAIFKLIPVVLTLPGIAGFLLSVGLAVDANILIFERIREELKWGRPRSLAVKFGFERAWSSIRDSNASSLLTAFILFYLGSGPVRGFALTLSIGILVSLFTAIFVTRALIEFARLDKDSTNVLVRSALWVKKLTVRKYADN
jgi:preprotein translocase subunit SecD